VKHEYRREEYQPYVVTVMNTVLLPHIMDGRGSGVRLVIHLPMSKTGPGRVSRHDGMVGRGRVGEGCRNAGSRSRVLAKACLDSPDDAGPLNSGTRHLPNSFALVGTCKCYWKMAQLQACV